MHIPPSTTLTHMHALTGQPAYAAALLFTCACYTYVLPIAYLHSYVHLQHVCTYIPYTYIHGVAERLQHTYMYVLYVVPATRMLTRHLQLNAIHTPVASDPLAFTVLKINHTRTDLFFWVCMTLRNQFETTSNTFYHAYFREREMLPTSSQKGLSRVGHERPLNTNSCADQPTNKRRVHESCIEGIRHR